MWALLPFATLGFATPWVFLFAAIRRRTRLWWLTFATYAVVFLLFAVFIDRPEGSLLYGIAGFAIFVGWLGGAAHAVATRRRVFEPTPTIDLDLEPALAAAVKAGDRRDLARQIIASDMALARSLSIGRPDLPRKYDDGGLVDANGAPESALMAVPGMDTAMAASIVGVRTTVGRFSSLEDMGVAANITPDRLDALREWLIFSP